MVYVNNPFTVLWAEGSFWYELILRAAAVLTFVHAWKRGYIVWVLTIFCLAVPLETYGQEGATTLTNGHCKAPSLIMWKACNEISLHACFWTVWYYPCALAIYRLSLPGWCRPFAIGFLTNMNGVPFDLGGAAAGMWRFAPHPGKVVGTTVYPVAFAQHLTCGLGCGILGELFFRKGMACDSAYGYPYLSCIQQIGIGCSPLVGYMFIMPPLLSLKLYIPCLIACGLVFMYGLTKRTPPKSLESDWMLLLGPISCLVCYLSYTALHLLNGFIVADGVWEYYPFSFSFTSSQYVTSLELQGAMTIIVASIAILASKKVNEPSTYSLMD